PGRPVFDPAMALTFVTGMVVGLARLRRHRWQWTWIWLGVFLAPTLLADSAPHYLRGYGVWPMLAILPAAGLVALVDVIKRRAGMMAAVLVGAGLAGYSVLTSVQTYYLSDWLTSREAYYAFDGFSTDMVLAVNQFTGLGWQGTASAN